MIHCNVYRIRPLLYLLKQAFICTAFFLLIFVLFVLLLQFSILFWLVNINITICILQL